MGKQKQTATRESGQGGAGRAGAVLTVYLTYDVNVSAAVIVWQNWSTTHTHTLTRMCMHFTTQLQPHAQQLRGSNARDVNSDGDGDVIVAPFWLLLFLTHWQAARCEQRQRQADVASLQTFRSYCCFCCCCWFYACVGILTFNVRQQLQMLAAMSASSLLLVIQSAAAAHAGGGGGGSTLKA